MCCDTLLEGSVTRPSLVFEQHRDEIRRFVLAHKVENPQVFGSVATGMDDDESDLDLMIDPVEGMLLFDLGGMSYRLEELLVSAFTLSQLALYLRATGIGSSPRPGRYDTRRPWRRLP